MRDCVCAYVSYVRASSVSVMCICTCEYAYVHVRIQVSGYRDKVVC